MTREKVRTGWKPILWFSKWKYQPSDEVIDTFFCKEKENETGSRGRGSPAIPRAAQKARRPDLRPLPGTRAGNEVGWADDADADGIAEAHDADGEAEWLTGALGTNCDGGVAFEGGGLGWTPPGMSH